VRDTFRPRIGGQEELTRNLITGAGAQAILVERSDNLVLHGNYIGLDPTGLEARPNALGNPLAFAVDVDTSDRSEAWDNTVASNLGGGIRLSNVTGTSVERNKIGVDATGRLALGNSGPGLSINGELTGTTIFDNVISANDGPGITCLEGALGSWTMKRNLIGVDVAQSDTIPNAGDGVRLELGCDGAVIGDEDPDDGNLIAHNEGAGVRAVGGTATIRGNALFLNDALAIDVGSPGRTENDVAGELLPTNYPEVTDFGLQDGELRIHACASPGSTIEVYEALTVPGGTTGALQLLGSGVEGGEDDADDSVGCSDYNEAAFELALLIEQSVTSVVLTATADGYTSELSDLVNLVAEPPEPDSCLTGIDCTVSEPICDPVFRRCVYCVDDEADDLLDSGCSAETPRCIEDAMGRRCAQPDQPPPRSGPPEPEPAAPGSRSGCSAILTGELTAGTRAWMLIACAAVLIRRRRLRTDT
jgi:hypothetical protein